MQLVVNLGMATFFPGHEEFHEMEYQEEITFPESSKMGETHKRFFGRRRQPFINTNLGTHLPKLYMNKFYGSDHAVWVSQME